MKRIFFLIILAIFFIGLISPFFAFAADPVEFCAQVTIPGFSLFTKGECKKVGPNTVADATAGIYKFIVGLAAIAAVVVMMAGGYVWLFAGGNASKVGEAKSLIGSAVFGLFLALGSYMILNLINPELIELKPLKIDTPSIAEIKGAVKICEIGDRNAAIAKLKEEDKQNFQCGSVYYPHYKDYEECLTENPKDKSKCDTKKNLAFSDGCMDVYCPEKTASLTNYACMIKLDKDFNFVGGGCESSINLFNPKTNAKDSLSMDDVSGQSCGNVKTWGSDEVANECGSGDADKYSCTALIGASDMPFYDGTSSGHVYFTYKGSKLKMSCRDGMILQMKKAPLYGWECGLCKKSTPYGGSFCGGDLKSEDSFWQTCLSKNLTPPVCCSK